MFLGNLNAVASVVTMFFLTVYGTINLVAAFEALSGDPSWRPRLRVPWIVNLIGGLGCLAVMMLINPAVGGMLAIVAEFGLWLPALAPGTPRALGRCPPRPLREPHPLGADQADARTP